MRLGAMCDFPHFLEHLAPLCHFLDMSLVWDDDEVLQACRTHFPTVKPEKFSMEAKWDVIFTSSKYSAEKLKLIFPGACFVFVPHGNSDKPMDIFAPQEKALIYGDQMASRLSDIETVVVGNYRKAFYGALPGPKKEITTVLYAPTWNDDTASTTFKETYPMLLDVPEGFHLLVKLHPFLEKSYPTDVLYVEEMCRVNPRTSWLYNDSPIYPTLARSDVYVGDFSSIGYDFLSFNRPLFFTSGRGGDLQSVGTLVEGNVYDCIANTPDMHQKARQALYDYAFSPMPSNLKEQILHATLSRPA